tara:strand:- start:21 stop:452 length:432 start_codon:yes stop_codon:yes gene_type:complete
MYERNELECLFADKHNIDAKGDWLLRVQSNPFFIAKQKLGYDIESSIFISKRQLKELVQKADCGRTIIYFWLNWGDQMRFDILAKEVNAVYPISITDLTNVLETGKSLAKNFKDGEPLSYTDAEDDDVWIIDASKFYNPKVEV